MSLLRSKIKYLEVEEDVIWVFVSSSGKTWIPTSEWFYPSSIVDFGHSSSSQQEMCAERDGRLSEEEENRRGDFVQQQQQEVRWWHQVDRRKETEMKKKGKDDIAKEERDECFNWMTGILVPDIPKNVVLS